MKTITRLFMLAAIVGSTALAFGQSAIDKEELLSRYEAVPSNGATPSHYFTTDELSWLRETLSGNENSRGAGGGFTVFARMGTLNQFGTVDVTVPATFNPIGPDSGSTDFEAAGDMNPVDLNTIYVLTLGSGEFYSVDSSTGTYTSLGTITPLSGEQWNGVEYDQTTNILYGISSNFGGQSTLSTIDVGAGTATAVGITGMPGAIAIGITDTGEMYGHDVVDDNFYSINKATGAATIIGGLGYDANFGQDLEYDPGSGTMYIFAYNSTAAQGELRTVNLGTGATAFVSALEGGNQIPWATAPLPSLSSNDPAASSFNLYPNPAQDVVYLKGLTEVTSITIFNILGQEVHQQKGYSSSGISVQHLARGTYMLQVVTPVGTATKKLVVR